MFGLKTASRFVAAAAVTSLVPMMASANFATNGDFETGDTAGWESFPTGSSVFEAQTSDVDSGIYSGRVFNDATGSAAVIKQANVGIGSIVPGDPITVTFRAKGNFEAGGVSFAEFFSELDGGGTSAAEIFGGAPLPLTSSYETYTFNTVAGPDVSGGVTLQFTATTGANVGSTAELFVDSVSITPEPATAAMFGLGGLAMLRRRKA